MQKDLKIGLFSGLVVVGVAVLWLATRPGLGPQSRLPDVGEPESNDHQAASPRPVAGGGGQQDRGVNPSGPVVASGRANTIEKSVEPTRTPAPPLRSDTTKPVRTHVVRDGETLSEISYTYYGSAAKWRKIFEANRQTIENPDVVMPGTKLIIPE